MWIKSLFQVDAHMVENDGDPTFVFVIELHKIGAGEALREESIFPVVKAVIADLIFSAPLRNRQTALLLGLDNIDPFLLLLFGKGF